MSKILLTENQLQMIKNQLVNEQVDDRYYKKEVKVRFESWRTSFNGNDIEDVRTNEKVILRYLIDIEARLWGIKDISLYAIEGPKKLNVDIEYYPQGSEDPETTSVDILLNWNKLDTNTFTGEGVVTIGETLSISLTNDENGDVVVSGMEIDVYRL